MGASFPILVLFCPEVVELLMPNCFLYHNNRLHFTVKLYCYALETVHNYVVNSSHVDKHQEVFFSIVF